MSKSRATQDGFKRVADHFRDADVFELCATLTVILLLFFGSGYWFIKLPTRLLGIAAILYPPLRRSLRFWFLMAAILAAGHFFRWFIIDNHQYLITYWCLALYMALRSDNVQETIAVNARLLIGLCFLFAVVWKFLSPDFLDGSTFHFLLLQDERFAAVAELLGDLPSEAAAQNRMVFSGLADASIRGPVALHDSPGVRHLAQLLTYWTIGIELLIACAFLLPPEKHLSKWRDLSLLVFVVTTYSIATVTGFGWVLIIMGVAQASPRIAGARSYYLGAFFFLQIVRAPWSEILQAVS